MMKFVQACGLGDVRENDWGPIRETASRDGSGECIFDGCMRGSSACAPHHAGLWLRRFGFLLLARRFSERERNDESQQNSTQIGQRSAPMAQMRSRLEKCDTLPKTTDDRTIL
jgi:hypothetical protein